MKLRNIALIATLFGSMALNAGVTHTLVHEDANNGDTDGWHIYDNYPSGTKIENVKDPQRGDVIKITGTTKNGVNFLGWETENHLIQWKMRADEWSSFYVVIQTSNGFRYLTYSPRDPKDKKNGIDSRRKFKIRFGLGNKMRDGKWHTFTRDVRADLKRYEPNNEFVQIDGIKFRGAGSFDDIKTMSYTTTPKRLRPLYIIGPSTVDTAGYVSTDGTKRRLEGWGEELSSYMKKPSNVINRARSGSNTTKYMSDFTDKKNIFYKGLKGRYWDDTKRRIEADKESKPFLLIQWGANESKTNETTFKNNLRTYISETEATPVLITSLNHRLLEPSRKNFPRWTREVAQEKNILLLDLNKRSVEIFQRDYTKDDVSDFKVNGVVIHKRIKKADKLYGYEEYERRGWDAKNNQTITKGINNAHLSPKGAKIVAGWIKDLACERASISRADGKELCAQFK